LFVILKKSPDYGQPVRREFTRLVIPVEFGIFGGNGDYFVIGIARVDHGHETDHSGVHEGERNHRFLTEHQNIEGIVIFGERLRDEAVVRGIKDGGVKNTVHADYSTGFVELILNVGVKRDFDDGIELVGNLVAGTQVVPGMSHGSLSSCDEIAGSLYYAGGSASGVLRQFALRSRNRSTCSQAKWVDS
jgi:hypothetical protein